MTNRRHRRAKRVEHRREHHGDVFVDPYEWLRDKSDPEVIDYLEAENAYTEQVTEHLAPLRQKIFDEIKARTKETDLSVPTRRGDWWYYASSFEGKQYSVQCRCPVTDPDDWTPPQLDEDTEIPGEQVLLDENVEAEGHDFFALGAATVSLDGNIAGLLGRRHAATSDTRCGSRTCAPAQLYDDEIVGIGAGATWAADNRTVYYITVDDAWRPDTVWRHRLGAGLPAEKVYHEPDEKFWLAVGRTRSDKYVIIAAGSAVTIEMRYADATDADAEFTPMLAAPRARRVLRRARRRRRRGPVPHPAQRRRGELHPRRGAGERPHRHPHAHRAPRRRPARRRRRVRRPPRGQLPQRGAAADPAVAASTPTATTASPRTSRSTPS